MNNCKVEGCRRVILAKELCNPHYRRMKRTGVVGSSSTRVMHLNGLSGHPLYGSWDTMRRRCNNPNATGYASYGGRGIRVCERWNSSFANFLEDVGERPDGLTLDRINNDNDYKPSNVKWSTVTEQAQNRRMNSRNTSGITGVSFDKYAKKWRGSFERNGRRLRGTFDTLQLAQQWIEQQLLDK